MDGKKACREESEGQKERLRDKSAKMRVGRGEAGGSSSQLCCVVLWGASQVNGGSFESGGRGPEEL